jgi:hypothetical protein
MPQLDWHRCQKPHRLRPSSPPSAASRTRDRPCAPASISSHVFCDSAGGFTIFRTAFSGPGPGYRRRSHRLRRAVSEPSMPERAGTPGGRPSGRSERPRCPSFFPQIRAAIIRAHAVKLCSQNALNPLIAAQPDRPSGCPIEKKQQNHEPV